MSQTLPAPARPWWHTSRHWRPNEARGRLLLLAGLVIFLGLDVVVAVSLLRNTHQDMHTDFFAFWTFSKFLEQHPAAQLYDPELLHHYQVGLGLPVKGLLPYLYPPSFLLVLWPWHLVGVHAGNLIWSIGTFLLYACALRGGPYGRREVPVALVLPTTMLCLLSGQNGFLTAALLIGGFRLCETRSILAGLCFGLLTFKPQLCVLLPVVLIAAARWRTLAAATAAALCTVLLSSALFGWHIWIVWLTQAPALNAYLDVNNSLARLAQLRPTLMPNLRALGLPRTPAALLQLAAAIAVAAVLWQRARRGLRPRVISLLFVGTFLATPYALYYDLPIVGAAVMAEAALSARENRAFALEAAVLTMFVLLQPFLTLMRPIPLASTGLLAWLFVFILHRDRQAAQRRA